jgi:hypothetical protein
MQVPLPPQYFARLPSYYSVYRNLKRDGGASVSGVTSKLNVQNLSKKSRGRHQFNVRIAYAYFYSTFDSQVGYNQLHGAESSARQEIPRPLHYPKFHYSIHHNLSPIPIISQINPVYAPFHCLKIHFSIIPI